MMHHDDEERAREAQTLGVDRAPPSVLRRENSWEKSTDGGRFAD